LTPVTTVLLRRRIFRLLTFSSACPAFSKLPGVRVRASWISGPGPWMEKSTSLSPLSTSCRQKSPSAIRIPLVMTQTIRKPISRA
jgi:hypothetical protein